MTIIEPLMSSLAVLSSIGWIGGWFSDASFFEIMKYFSLPLIVIYDAVAIDYAIRIYKERKARKTDTTEL